MGLFYAKIGVRIRIEGCPESGIPALEYRRAHGLAERLDDRSDVSIDGEISEDEFRALVTAGWKASNRDGAQVIHFCGLEREYDPTSTYGHAAVMPVSATDTPTNLACRALVLCASQQSIHVAEKREKQRKEAIQYAGAYVAGSIDQRLSLRSGRPWGNDICHDYLDEPLRSRYEQALADTERAVAERKAANEAAETARKEAYDAERSAWIADYGSPRLQRLAAKGIGHNQTYRDERLAIDRPGYVWFDLVCGSERDIRDASEDALDALDAERKLYPEAELVWVANGEPGEEFEPGPAIFMDFLGSRIAKRI